MATTAMTKLYRLLAEGDPEQRVAAAIVLGEFAPKEKAAVARLASVAETSDGPLRLKAIEALGKIGTAPARERLYPFLDGSEAVRRTAVAALARTGNPAVAHIKKELPDVPFAKKRTYLRALAAIGTKDAMAILLKTLEEPHPSLVADALRVFREETGAIDPAHAGALSKQIRDALESKGFVRNRTALESAIHMLNHLRDPDSVQVLLQFSKPEHAPSIRQAALTGLRWVLPEQSRRDAAVKLLLGFLEEEDFQHVVAPALEALQPLSLPKGAADTLIALAESRHPLVRKFALSKMSEIRSVNVVRTLVGALSDPDPMIRELASRSLEVQPSAWKTVVESLDTCTDVDLAWRMVHAVRADGSRVTTDALQDVVKGAIGRLESSDPMAEPMLNLVQALAPDVHFDSLFKRALYWKRKRQFAEMELCLRPLTTNDRATDDSRFELAIASLKNSNATAGAIARDTDLSLAIMKTLLKSPDFSLMKKLLGEKDVLDPADYYYLGFHLIEGTTAERELGADLLKRLVETTPRSKVGRSAKSKLRIEGLL